MTERKKSQPHTQSVTNEPFVFTNVNQKLIDNILSKYPPGKQSSAILPLLDLAQRQSGGWLPR